MTSLDKRRHAFRLDLADVALKGRVEAAQFVKPTKMTVITPTMALRSEPDMNNGFTSQALLGDEVNVFEQKAGWAWVQLKKDGYVGYAQQSALVHTSTVSTHRITVPSTFIYPKANLKTQSAVRIFMNSLVTVVSSHGDWSELAQGGFIYASHLAIMAHKQTDPVAVAEKFLNTPYLWGGNTHDGLDCSGLVQEAYHACDLICPRDSDMIESEIGEPNPNTMQRGDLVFWDGHIGMVTDGKNMIHANGYHMAVVREEFAAAQDRISRIYGSRARFKRL